MSYSDLGGAIVLGPDDGAVLEARGSRMTFKAVASLTDGAFSLMERDLPPGGRRPPPHRHPGTLEAFFILEGEVEFLLGKQSVRQAPEVVRAGDQRARPNLRQPRPAQARDLVLQA